MFVFDEKDKQIKNTLIWNVMYSISQNITVVICYTNFKNYSSLVLKCNELTFSPVK